MMLKYLEMLEEFPEELRRPLAKLFSAFEEDMRARFEVRREDLQRLSDAVEELIRSHREAEKRLTKLEETADKLLQAHASVERRLSSLEERATRLERAVEGLERAVEGLERAVERLERAVDELRETQRSLDTRVRRVEIQIGALGARWGIGSEEAFRNGMRGILEELGFRVERYTAWDEEGVVFGRPEQVELDVVITDGKTAVVEIKSSVSRGDVAAFQRKAEFYERKEGRRIDRKVIISPFFEPGAREMAEGFGMELFTCVLDFQ